MTPLAPGAQGTQSAPSTVGRFRAAGASGARRAPARSRYVDTFNPAGDGDGGAAAAADANPPPSRPKPAAPAYKVFTPQKTGGEGEEPHAGNATPLFMAPSAPAEGHTNGDGPPQ